MEEKLTLKSIELKAQHFEDVKTGKASFLVTGPNGSFVADAIEIDGIRYFAGKREITIDEFVVETQQKLDYAVMEMICHFYPQKDKNFNRATWKSIISNCLNRVNAATAPGQDPIKGNNEIID